VASNHVQENDRNKRQYHITFSKHFQKVFLEQEWFLHSPMLEPFDNSFSGEEVYKGKMLNTPMGGLKKIQKYLGHQIP